MSSAIPGKIRPASLVSAASQSRCFLSAAAAARTPVLTAPPLQLHLLFLLPRWPSGCEPELSPPALLPVCGGRRFRAGAEFLGFTRTALGARDSVQRLAGTRPAEMSDNLQIALFVKRPSRKRELRAKSLAAKRSGQREARDG